MYADKNKQKQANRDWIAKKRADAKKKTLQDAPGYDISVVPDINVVPKKVVPAVVPSKVVPSKVIPDNHTCVIPKVIQVMTPEGLRDSVPVNWGEPDCQCLHCRTNRQSGNKYRLNHGAYKLVAQLKPNEFNRVSMPGDIDYQGIAAQYNDIVSSVPVGGQ